MSFAKVVVLLILTTIAVLMAISSPADAACACSGVGVSNGYYAQPCPYGAYGYGPGYSPQVQARPRAPKGTKSKKTAPKAKPDAQ
jgi:hypothetical protein